MPHDTPVLKVSRPVAACSRCRTAKTKCDGRLPACSSCVRAGKADECSSIDDQFAKGKERSYPAFLESNINKLRKRLSEARRAELDPMSPVSVVPHSVPASSPGIAEPGAADGVCKPPVSPSVRSRKKCARSEAHDIDELVSNFGVLTVNAATRDYQGFSSLMSVARVTLWTLIHQRDLGPKQPLPSRQEATELGREYLNSIFQILPVIEASSFWTSLEAVYWPDQDFASPFQHFVVRMVIANGLICRSRIYGDNWYQAAGGHADSAMLYAESVLRPDDLSSVQAMLLLVEYSRYDPRRFDPWMVTGAATRAMTDLGLHQDPPKSAQFSKSQMESRRRAFMCVYSMDRLIAIGMDRAFSFSDASVNVDVASSLIGSPATTAAHASMWNKSYEYGYLHFKIRQVQSAIHADLYQTSRTPMLSPYPYIWQKWHETQAWYDGLPSSRPRPLHHLTNIERLATFIHLLVPCERVPKTCELAQSLVFEYGLEYARGMQTAIEDQSISLSLSFTSGLRVRKIASMFLSNLDSHRAHILSGSTPKIEATGEGCATPPAYLYPPRHDNPDRLMQFVHQMRGVLVYLSNRCGMPEWHTSFEAEAQRVLSAVP